MFIYVYDLTTPVAAVVKVKGSRGGGAAPPLLPFEPPVKVMLKPAKSSDIVAKQ